VGTFAEDIVVTRVHAGSYGAVLDHGWDLVPLPQGGIMVALGLRAAQAEVADPAQRLRSFTTVFAGQVSAGELEIDVQTLRRGRSATQVSTTVRNAGESEGATTVAVFGGDRRGPAFVDVERPQVPPPDECPSYRDAPPPGVEPMETWPFWTRVEGRAALGHAPWEDYEPTSSEVATWLRFDQPPLLADGSHDPLGVVALADRMPGCVRERTGPGGDRWFAPSADLTVHLFEPLRTEWLLAHDRAVWAGEGWASAQSTLWSQDGVLVARAVQTMLFTYLPG